MAKKKASGGFVMAEEIRKLLKENRKMSVSEVYKTLVERFPKQSINQGSCSVAFYGARDALGIKSSRAGGKRKKSGSKRVVMKRTPASAGSAVDMAALQAAAKFVSEVGDANTAIEAIRQLKLVQIQ